MANRDISTGELSSTKYSQPQWAPPRRPSEYSSRPQYRRGSGHVSWAVFNSLRQCPDWSRNTRTCLAVTSNSLRNAVKKGKAPVIKVSPVPEGNVVSCLTQGCAFLSLVFMLCRSQAGTSMWKGKKTLFGYRKLLVFFTPQCFVLNHYEQLHPVLLCPTLCPPATRRPQKERPRSICHSIFPDQRLLPSCDPVTSISLSERRDNQTGWPISHEIHLFQHVFSPIWGTFTLPVISTTVKTHCVTPR